MVLRDVKTIQAATVEIYPTDPEYPSAWGELSDAPKVLYAIGNISLLKERSLAVVGSRRTPINALKLGGEICKELSESLALWTGSSDGGDTAATEGALAGGGKVVCLLAGGFSSLPQSNLALMERVANRGLLLSPHSYETEVRTYSYEYRNKLLAKGTEGVFVLGAGEKSGALITAKYAEKFGKRVFALPYPPNSASGVGCNALLKRGGYLTENSGDIVSRYGIELNKKERALVLTKEESALYEALRECLEAHANELAARTGFPVFKLRGLLSALEVKGLVVSLGGNRYAVV